MEQKKTTPEFITELQPNEIFVFGSNLKGMHGGGAAYIAYRKFGAIMGQGVGLQVSPEGNASGAGFDQPVHAVTGDDFSFPDDGSLGAELYEAVANVLAFVYKIKGQI